jgi:hypothetical protein
VAAFAISVAGVAQQRSSRTRAAIRRRTAAWGTSDRWASLYQVPCPTASTVRAQIWFELKSGGLRVLTTGATLAFLIPLLFVLGRFLPWPTLQAVALGGALLSPPSVLLLGAMPSASVPGREKSI